MYPYKSTFYSLAISILLLAGCSQDASQSDTSNLSIIKDSIVQVPLIVQSEQQEVIDKPFEHIDIPFQNFTYNPKKSNEIHLKSGTHITIPANSFEDENGNPVSENITIKYREMHTIDDIILTGIKMDYDGSDFETAGMFEIRAYNEDRELSLKKDKDLTVELASFRTGDFDRFYMDEAKKEWQILPVENVKKNQRKAEKLVALDNLQANTSQSCSIEPREYQLGDEVFDLNYSLNHTSLSLLHGAMWILDGSAMDKAIFNNIGDKYDHMNLKPTDDCDKYELTLEKKVPNSDEKKIHKFSVIPVWKGKEFEKAKVGFVEKVNKLRSALKEIAQQKIIAEKEADILRSFSLKGMGIYNCDRVIRYLKLVTVGIALTCTEKIKSWWYITNNKQIAIRYFSPEDPNFKYNPNSNNSIIAVVEGGRVAHVSSEDFIAAISDYNQRPDRGTPLELNLIVEGEPIQKVADFKNALATN